MDPKQSLFKSPDTSASDPSFGAKLVGWVKTDMARAQNAREQKAREDAKAKADAKADSGKKAGRAG